MTTNDVAAYLSNVLYSDFAKGDSFGDAGRFVVKDVIDDPASGYYGAVIHDTYTGDGILVNRGTEIDPIDTNDFLNANASIAFGGLGGQQYTSAQQFLSNYLNDPNQNVAVTATTGHSLGGYLAQVVGMTRGLDVIAIASPGANNALNDLANTSYASQVAAYDKSRITVINDPRDSVGQHNEQIAEINYQTVDLNDLVLQSDKGNIYSFIANQTEYDVDFFDALVVFGPVTAISSFAVESWAGLAYHNRDFYQQVITQNYNEVNNSPALISIATVENGDTISFYETITKIDSSTGSDITFLEYSDGNIYGLRNNPDGSKAFFYKDQQGNTISRNFESFDNLEGLDGNEKRLVEEIRVRELLEEKAAALEQIQSNPDIVNDPSFNDLPLGVQEKILELLETGELALEETAPKTEIITVSETISSDLLVSAYLEGDGLGSGADILSVSSLVHAIQNGPKSAQIDASLELYKRVVNEGSYNGDLGFYELDGAILQAVPNAYGGFAEKITYNGQDQVYFTRYGEGSFQQRVVETVGEDGRTNTAQITLIDGLVNQLYHGEPIQISYPENFDYGATTGIIADVIGQQLENGELAHDIISGAIIRTLGTNAGEVLDFLAAGNTLAESVFDPIFGVDGSNPNMPRADIIDDLLVNLQSSVVSVISSKLVEELGDVIGIDGVGGEVFDVAAGTITTGVVNETFGLLFNGLDTGVYTGILSGGLNFSDSLPDGITVPEGVETVGDYVQYQVVNALAAYAGNSLAGEVVEPESEIAAIFGSAGSAIGTAIATGSLWASSGIATAFANLGWAGGPLGVAIGAFIGNVAGTFLGNVFGGEDEPWAGARGGYDSDTQLYKIGSWGTDDGGDASIARSMLQQVINGVNSVLEITQGKIRSGAKAPGIEIGYDGDEYFVAIEGQYKVFSTAVDAIYHASYKLMSEFDLVGGHAVIMRAWHNTDADNLFELKEDLEVAEAFQNYLANPTAILALMMNEPESELAQSWAAILQRAAELELHLPHDKDLDGGWSEILLAQGADPSLIPDIQGDNIVLTDPVTGEETVVHHVIGPGYEIVRIEGTDGNDIIEVIVDGPSISYVNAGAGDDVIEGSEQDDILVGGAGDDTINGNGGNDWLHGGTGDDNLDGGAGEDLIVGGMQNDYLIGGDDNDHIYGNHGDDILMGMAGQDFLYGGQGNDVLHGDNDNGVQDFLYGEEGDDVFHLNYNELAYGGAGNDTFLFSHAAKNNNIYISRGDGHDVIEGDPTYHNALIFDETIGGNELFYQRIGMDLKITVLGENQSVTVTDYFSGSRSISIMNHGGWYRAEVNGSGREAITNMVNADANIAGHLTTEYGVISDGYLAQRGDAWQQNFVHKDPSHVRSYITHDEHVSEQLYVHWNNWLAYGGAGKDEIINLEPTAYNHNRFYGDSGNDKIYGGHGNDTLVGGLGNDLLRGDLHDDRLYGGHGNDNLLGGDQNDELHGGAGNDTLKGQQHNDVMYGGDGDDYIQDYHDDNELYGGQGNDTITTYAEGFAGNNKIHGNEGHDIITGGYGDDWISADEGDDTVIDMGGINWIYLGEGNDTVNVRGGSNNVYGDAGDDVFTMNFVSYDLAQYFSGGEGNDILKIYMNAVDYTTAIEADIKAAYDFITFSEKYNQNSLTLNNINVYLAGIETFEFYLDDVLQTNINEYIGDQNNNTIVASLYNDVIRTGAGDDYITASAGDDYIEAGTGSDTIYGQEGNDTIYAGGWSDVIFGDGGWNSTYGGDDTIYAEAGDDTVHGRAGNDTIYGGDGHDELNGHEGEDIIYGGAGVDVILGDGGWNAPYAYDDQLHGGEGNDDINGGGGNDTIFGDEGNDLLKGANGDDTIDGGIGIDRLEGGNGNDTLHGGEGNDLLFGDNDNDTLYGDAGFDKLNGGAGDDVLYASAGWDYLIGDTGDDVFVFSSLDDHNQGNGNQYNRVRDFNDIDDSIDISSVLDTIYDPLTDALADFVNVIDNGAHTYIRVDGDGVGTDLAMNTIAMIEGYTGHGKDLETMINEGKLIV